MFAPPASMIVFREDDPAFIAARSEEKPPGSESICEHAFLRGGIGAEARRDRPSIRPIEGTCIAHRRSPNTESSALGAWHFDGHADKAMRSLLRAIALRRRHDASHSKSTSCKMRTRRAFCFAKALRERGRPSVALKSAMSGWVVAARFRRRGIAAFGLIQSKGRFALRLRGEGGCAPRQLTNIRRMCEILCFSS